VSFNTDQVIAIGAAVFAAGSAVFAYLTARAAGQAIRAQTFLEIMNTAREVKFSSYMDTVRGLHNREYVEFIASEPVAAESVRTVVDFLNDVAHLIRHGYIKPQHILLICAASIQACDQLRTWWLSSFRNEKARQAIARGASNEDATAESKYYYEHFDFLCRNVQALKKGERVNWSLVGG